MSQHAGPLRGPADEGQRTQETQSQGEEQQEAQLRVVGFDNGCGSVIGKYKGHNTGAEGANEGNSRQNNAHGAAEGEEIHIFWDTGCSLIIGPELWQTAHTLYGILNTQTTSLKLLL